MSNAADMSELLANAFVEDAPPIADQHQSFAGVLDKVYVSPDNVVKILSIV